MIAVNIGKPRWNTRSIAWHVIAFASVVVLLRFYFHWPRPLTAHKAAINIPSAAPAQAESTAINATCSLLNILFSGPVVDWAFDLLQRNCDITGPTIGHAKLHVSMLLCILTGCHTIRDARPVS